MSAPNQGSTGPTLYADPLAGAKVTPERVDQGVDYAGTGSISAIARGVVTKILGPNDSGWPGSYVEYKITQPGPLFGKLIFSAEGVTPTVKVGQTVNAGDTIANLIPGWHSGIELGFASGIGSEPYAASHGGYTEGETTAAGSAFSKLVAALGGPPGIEHGTPVGSAPVATGTVQAVDNGSVLSAIESGAGAGLNAIVPGAGLIPGAGGAVVSGATSAFDAAQAIGNFVSNPIPTLLTIGLVILGASLAYTGAKHMVAAGQENAP